MFDGAITLGTHLNILLKLGWYVHEHFPHAWLSDENNFKLNFAFSLIFMF